MKKVLSVCLILAMMLGTLSALTFTTAADGAVDLPANTFIVNLAGVEADTTCTWMGTTYNVTYGTNYFNSFNGARDKMTTPGGTILLMPGSYAGFAPSKSMTILGAKAGINPNVKGANVTDDWTLNPDRSADTTKESVLTGAVYLTAGDDTMLGSPIDLVIDGVTFNGGYIRSIIFAAGTQAVTVKNAYCPSISSVQFMWSADSTKSIGLATNLCSRSITMQNVRFDGTGSNPSYNLFPTMTADYFMADGVYMGGACTGAFIESIYMSKAEGEASYTIQNSMFRTNNRQLNLSFRNDGGDTKPFASLKADNAGTQKNSITVTVKNNVFAGRASGSKNIQPQPHGNNYKIVISDNVFSGPYISSFYPIADYAESKFTTVYEMDNNTVINGDAAFANIGNISDSSPLPKITRTLFLDKNGAVKTNFACYNKFDIQSYYLDAAKTTLHYKNNAVLAFKGVQLSTPADNKVNIRFIVAVDDLDYAKAGLSVTAKEGEGAVKSASFDVKTVYTSITAATDEGIAAYSAADLGGKYLMAVTLTGVPANVGTLTFTVKATAEQTSGDKIDGTQYQIVMKNGAVASEDITKIG